jgi:hypothetical protein
MMEISGFLMYVVRTYTWMNPYLKGRHLTINRWRQGRGEDGFKWTAKERRQAGMWSADVGVLPCQRVNEGLEGEHTEVCLHMEETNAPETVEPVERYLRDLECLKELTDTTEPPQQLY